MFKFLKDKLKGALSNFSKKVEEAEGEEKPAEEKPEEIKEEPKVEEKKEEPVKEEKVEKPKEVVEKPKEEKKEEPKVEEKKTEPVEEKPVEKVEEKKEEKKIEEKPAEPEKPAETPKITIQEEKKGIFSKIKGIFKKEEITEIHEEKKPDVPLAEPVKDIIVEEPALEVEGSPLKKVDIHKEEEEKTELPAIEGLFERPPGEPEPAPKKEIPASKPEEYHPEKVADRIIKEEELVEKTKVEEPAKKGFFKKLREAVTTKKISETRFDQLFWDLEVALLENNVAVEVIDKIKSDLKKVVVDQPIPRGKVEGTILASLKKSLQELFDVPTIDLLEKAKSKKPFVIAFVGINGSGKTTTIAKMAHLFQTNKLTTVLAAADTFRAAAIDQLQLHADKLKTKLIKHDYGSDPAAVAFDAIKHAEANKKDVVLIDTAGRLHSNINLIDEMKKIIRVAKPDCIIFVGESITGNDCVEQAKKFNDAVGIDGIILSKADIDEKGGAAISVSYITKKPILYLGVGQEYGDLKKFDPKQLLESLGL